MSSAYSITSKHQVTIPKFVRNRLQLAANDRVSFVIEGDKVYLQKVPSLESVADEMRHKTNTRRSEPASDAEIGEAREKFYREKLSW